MSAGDLSHSDSLGPAEAVICFVGASVLAGVGDPKALGWVGRVVARSIQPDLRLTAYNLGVRGQTSADVLRRWRVETEPRWRVGAARKLVLQAGAADLDAGISLARSRLNLATVLDDAIADGIAPFVVGLTPVLDDIRTERLQVLADDQAEVCERRGVPYVDCLRPLRGHEQWEPDLGTSDGVHPRQAGYGLIAWLVLHNGWTQWLSA